MSRKLRKHFSECWTYPSPVIDKLFTDVQTEQSSIQSSIQSTISELDLNMSILVNELINITGSGFNPDDFRVGNIVLNNDGSGWTYLNSNTRVSTKEGVTISLLEDDTVGLTDYTDARFYISWVDGNGDYHGQGWLTQDYTLTQDGDYVINICHLTDTVLSNKAELLNLLFITRSSGE